LSGLFLVPVGIALLSLVAVLVAFPFWPCPWCDQEAWDRYYIPGTIRLGWTGTTCRDCNDTRKMSLLRRGWELHRIRVLAGTRRIPLFP
jgi:hypothetical protein